MPTTKTGLFKGLQVAMPKGKFGKKAMERMQAKPDIFELVLIAPRKVGAREEIRAASGTIVTKKKREKNYIPFSFHRKEKERPKMIGKGETTAKGPKGTSSSVESNKPVCHHEKKGNATNNPHEIRRSHQNAPTTNPMVVASGRKVRFLCAHAKPVMTTSTEK